jgi:RND family efflux transporter MFP subunit
MLDVPEADLPYVAEGQAVELSLDAAPGRTFTSSIALLEPQLDGSSRTVRARVPVANADGALRAGMFARAAITMSAPVDARALRVPSDAIQPVGDADAVFVERGEGLFEVRTIRIARRTAQIVEVAEGLSAGERIVVAGAFVVRAEVTRQ